MLLAAAAAIAGAARARVRATGAATTVRVTVTDLRCTLSRTSAPVGAVRFVVANRGRSRHAFVVAGKATRALKPGQQAALVVRFAKAGAVAYRCTIPGRPAAAIRGTFRAAGPKPATAKKPPATTTTAAPPRLTLTRLASGLGTATDVVVSPTDPNRVFFLSADGRITMLAPDGTLSVAADLGRVVHAVGENGLLAMTFSPTFASDRTAYVYYNAPGGNNDDTLAAVLVRGDWSFDLDSLRVVLGVHVYGGNHRGGDIAFGPDGHLYLPIGDSDNGTYTTVGQYAQDPGSMLGGIVRIDPTPYAPQPDGRLYTIPANPPVAGGAPPELWAKGLRNPWRDYVDAANGLLYIGDVGLDDREEIDVVPLSGGGYNFGWPCVEGTLAHPDSPVRCPDASQLTAPVLEYTHDGACGVIAGVVVHDPRLAALEGQFLYSDICSGRLRAFTYSGGKASGDRDLGVQVTSPNGFGEGPDGRIYVVDNEGDAYRLDPAP